jgi:hypothetical protein
MVVINCWSSLLLLWIFLSKLEATSLREIDSSARVSISRDGINNDLSYGIDVSWPIQHNNVSCNFPWLPHNSDPYHHPVPLEYEGMPLQPLGDRYQRYKGKYYQLLLFSIFSYRVHSIIPQKITKSIMMIVFI